MKRVVIGLLGTQKDAVAGPQRWSQWRPSVGICQQADMQVDRFELLVEPKFASSAAAVVKDIAQVSPDTEVRVHELSLGADPWDFETVFDGLMGFAQSYDFKPEREEYLIHITTGTHVAQICLFLLTEARFLPGKLLQSQPAGRRPRRSGDDAAGLVTVIDLDLSRFDRIATRLAQDSTQARHFLKSGIATKSKGFNALIERIEQVAIRSSEPILLCGPTGAGKSQLAERIYDLRRQRAGLKGKFIEVNCATLRGDAALSTLFGHVRGAFTGAHGDRAGLLREADKGVLFLDEIGELGLDEQAMLLRALETRNFSPYGSDKTVRSDFQLIAGTNRHIAERVREGRFREDLHARINLWTFDLPGLAERREDIAPNLDYELERASQRLGRKVTMNKEARDAFLRFARSSDAAWRANFRDLNAAVTRLATLADKGRITEALVSEETQRLKRGWDHIAAPAGTAANAERDLLTEVLGAKKRALIDPFDQAQLAYVLAICRASKTLSEAGRKLFAVSRVKRSKANDADRLSKYLARFGLTWRGISDDS